MVKKLKLIPLFLCLFSLCSCWDSTDIQQQDIHIAEVIDYHDGKYNFYGEVADLSGQSQTENGGGSQSFSITHASGKNFTEARDDLNRKSPNPVYLGACKVLIFTDRLASLGVEEYLNRSRTQPNTRKSLKIITIPDEPEDFLKAEEESSSSVGLAVDNMMDTMIGDGSSFRVDIGSLLEALAVKKAGFLIPSISLEDENLTFKGYTVFKDAKSKGFIPAEEGRGIVYFLNPNGKFSYEVIKSDNKFQLEATLTSKKIKTAYNKGKIKIDVQMNFTAGINYMDKIRQIDDKEKKEVENLLSKKIKEDITSALKTSQETYSSDYLQIYRYFRAEYGSDFDAIDWEKAYSEAVTEVESKVKITLSEVPQK